MKTQGPKRGNARPGRRPRRVAGAESSKPRLQSNPGLPFVQPRPPHNGIRPHDRRHVATLQTWEQGRRRPEGPARALLKVTSVNPEAVAIALAGYRNSRYGYHRRSAAGKKSAFVIMLRI